MPIDPLKPLDSSLFALVRTTMPFGKYKGILICDLPEAYLIWFAHKGFPKDDLGDLMGLMTEIKCNGLEHLLDPLRSQPYD
jgi:uncharacterized protein